MITFLFTCSTLIYEGFEDTHSPITTASFRFIHTREAWFDWERRIHRRSGMTVRWLTTFFFTFPPLIIPGVGEYFIVPETRGCARVS